MNGPYSTRGLPKISNKALQRMLYIINSLFQSASLLEQTHFNVFIRAGLKHPDIINQEITAHSNQRQQQT